MKGTASLKLSHLWWQHPNFQGGGRWEIVFHNPPLPHSVRMIQGLWVHEVFRSPLVTECWFESRTHMQKKGHWITWIVRAKSLTVDIIPVAEFVLRQRSTLGSHYTYRALVWVHCSNKNNNQLFMSTQFWSNRTNPDSTMASANYTINTK